LGEKQPTTSAERQEKGNHPIGESIDKKKTRHIQSDFAPIREEIELRFTHPIRFLDAWL